MHILSLPAVMLEHVLSFLNYDQIAKNRIVCKDFDIICQRLLNRGFQMIERRISANLKAIKCKLPRRESERRYHRLSKHCDILTSVDTRLSMLKMTYNCFIEQGKCCFIPGKIIDELHNVMTIVDESNPLPMAFEVLQELRDISGMAIEHFEEVVAPTLRQKVDDYSRMVPMPVIRNETDKKSLNPAAGAKLKMFLLREACLRNNKSITKMEKKFNVLTRKLEYYKRLMTFSKRQLIQKQIEQTYKIADLKRRIEEYEVKFKELSATTGHKNYLKDSESNKVSESTKVHIPHAVKMRLKNFSSQIKLDPSPFTIGSYSGSRGSPIMKPRRASLIPPNHKSSEIASPKSDSFMSNLMSNRQRSSEGNEGAKCRSPKAPKRKSGDVKILSDNSLNVLHQLNKVFNQLPEEDKSIKRKPKTDGSSAAGSSKSHVQNNPWLCRMMNIEKSKSANETQPMPGTSKSYDAADSKNENRSRKRPYSDAFEEQLNSADDGTRKGFQAKVQLLSRTIMKLIESLSDTTEARRRRTENE